MAARWELQQATRAPRTRSCSLRTSVSTDAHRRRSAGQHTVRHRVSQSRFQELHAVLQLGNLRCQLFFAAWDVRALPGSTSHGGRLKMPRKLKNVQETRRPQFALLSYFGVTLGAVL